MLKVGKFVVDQTLKITCCNVGEAMWKTIQNDRQTSISYNVLRVSPIDHDGISVSGSYKFIHKVGLNPMASFKGKMYLRYPRALAYNNSIFWWDWV